MDWSKVKKKKHMNLRWQVVCLSCFGSTCRHCWNNVGSTNLFFLVAIHQWDSNCCIIQSLSYHHWRSHMVIYIKRWSTNIRPCKYTTIVHCSHSTHTTLSCVFFFLQGAVAICYNSSKLWGVYYIIVAHFSVVSISSLFCSGTLSNIVFLFFFGIYYTFIFNSAVAVHS